MNPALRVLTPGLLTTVQDFGRPGHQRLGIPVSGALDPVSLRAANDGFAYPATGIYDISRAREELGYKLEYDLERGIADYLKALKQLGA